MIGNCNVIGMQRGEIDVDNHHKSTEKLNLSDYLALDRTKLANERTYLAYIRTFIALLAAGVGLIRLVENTLAQYGGIVLCVLSPLFFIVGTYHFLVMRRRIREQERDGKGN